MFCSYEEGEIEEGEITSSDDEDDRVAVVATAAAAVIDVGDKTRQRTEPDDDVGAANVTPCLLSNHPVDGAGDGFAGADESASGVQRNRLCWLPVSLFASWSLFFFYYVFGNDLRP